MNYYFNSVVSQIAKVVKRPWLNAPAIRNDTDTLDQLTDFFTSQGNQECNLPCRETIQRGLTLVSKIRKENFSRSGENINFI